MSEIKILQLSDLHLDSSNTKDPQIILNALWKDLDHFKGIDFILFTGDLVKGGDSKDSFEKAFQIFIEPLLNKTNVSKDNFFIVPGNHDVQIKSVDEIIEEGLERKLIDRDSLNSFLDEEIENGFRRIERLDHFNHFKNHTIGAGYAVRCNKLFSSHIVKKNNTKFGVACLNSAWRTAGKGGDHDNGKMLIGERQIYECLEDIRDCDIKIAIHHHPLDWLSEDDKNDTEDILFKEFDFIFCGHLHRANLKMVKSLEDEIVVIQGGSLYKGRSHYNGYSVLSIHPQNNNGTLYLRTYFDGRKKFDKAVDRCDDGKMLVTMKKIPPKREWALELAAQLNSKVNQSQTMYLECSSQSVSRKLGKLETLLEIDGILNEDEREVLVAAQYLHSLNSLGEDLIKSKDKLCEVTNISKDFATAAVITADAVCPNFDLDSSDMNIGNIRCDLLAALLRVGKILDFDREAIVNSKYPPPGQDCLDHWRAFLTKQVIVKRGGLVTFHLLVSKNNKKQNDLFKKFIALSFEALLQKLRNVLTKNGVAISRSHSRITVSPEIGRLTGSILRQIEEEIKKAKRVISGQQPKGENINGQAEQTKEYIKCHGRPVRELVTSNGFYLQTEANELISWTPDADVPYSLFNTQPITEAFIDREEQLVIGLFESNVAHLKEGKWEYIQWSPPVLSLVQTDIGIVVGDSGGNLGLLKAQGKTTPRLTVQEPVTDILNINDEKLEFLGAKGGLWTTEWPFDRSSQVKAINITDFEHIFGLIESKTANRVILLGAARIALLDCESGKIKNVSNPIEDSIRSVYENQGKTGGYAVLTDEGGLYLLSDDLKMTNMVKISIDEGRMVGVRPLNKGGFLAWTTDGNLYRVEENSTFKQIADKHVVLAFPHWDDDGVYIVRWYEGKGIHIQFEHKRGSKK